MFLRNTSGILGGKVIGLPPLLNFGTDEMKKTVCVVS